MRLTICIYFIFVPLFLNSQTIIYVSKEATGIDNGASWHDAFSTLESALQISSSGDQIWVSKGTYLPANNASRDNTFLLPEGVSIWGGFSGWESVLSQRDVGNNETAVSGDIGIPNLQSDNSFHVFTIHGGDSLTIIDGFTILNGNADGADNEGLLARGSGGGILVVSDDLRPVAAPIIRNCRFEQNRALRGGGIACIGTELHACVPEIKDCLFIRNRAEIFGASMYKTGINLPERPFKVSDCLFERNFCQQVAGGIAIMNSSGVVQLKGCTFQLDTGRLEVGGVYLETGNNKIRYEIDSCNFTANYSYNGCGGVAHLVYGFFLDTVELIIRKSNFLLNHNAIGTGGGFASYAYSDYHKLLFEDCHFESNLSQNGGGGIFIEGNSGTFSDIKVDRCFFLGNQTGAASIAGAFYYRGFGTNLTKNRSFITNSVFMFNDGAVTALGGNPGISNTHIVNCSFYRNGANPFVKYWGAENNPVNLVMKMQLLNCIIWEPQTEGIHRIFYNNDPFNFTVNDYKVEYCMINLSNCIYNGFDPCSSGMIYNKWPDFIDSSGQLGLVPWPEFSGLNKGNTLIVDTFNITKDFQRKDRIFCDSVDIGAYEIQGNCSVSTSVALNDLPYMTINMHNILPQGKPISAELLSSKALNLNLLLTDKNGNVLFKQYLSISSINPEFITISTDTFNSGIYFFTIIDGNGGSKTFKILLL